jgi:hypothetical protein
MKCFPYRLGEADRSWFNFLWPVIEPTEVRQTSVGYRGANLGELTPVRVNTTTLACPLVTKSVTAAATHSYLLGHLNPPPCRLRSPPPPWVITALSRPSPAPPTAAGCHSRMLPLPTTTGHHSRSSLPPTTAGCHHFTEIKGYNFDA